MEEDVIEVLNTLTPREKTTLKGVLVEGLSLEQMGERLDLSRERVRFILGKGADKMLVSYRQDLLTGATRRMLTLREEDREDEENRKVIQEVLRGQLIQKIKADQEQYRNELRYKLEQNLEVLCLPARCERKLKDFGITTVDELLRRFPYNMETNELEHFLDYSISRLNKVDYFDVWNALYEWGLLVRLPVLPDCLISEQEKKEMLEQRALPDDLREDCGCPFDNDPLGLLNLSVRSYNCMVRAGIKNFQDFYQWCKCRDVKTKEELGDSLMRIRNLGRKSCEEVYAAMKHYGWLDFLE